MNKKIILIFCLLCFVSIAGVCASDNVTDDSLNLPEGQVDDSLDLSEDSVEDSLDSPEDSVDDSLEVSDVPAMDSSNSSETQSDDFLGSSDDSMDDSLNSPDVQVDDSLDKLANQNEGNGNQAPVISINSSKTYTGGSIDIYLKDANKVPIKNQRLTANINGKDHFYTTDSNGKVCLKLSLKPDKYTLKVMFKGNGTYSAVNKTFSITVSKINFKISPVATKIVKGDYFYIYLKDQNNRPFTYTKVTFTVNGKKYTVKTDDKGKAGVKINLNPSKYPVNVYFAGNDYYNSASKTINVVVAKTTSLVIGNDKLLTKGYLRVYLKSYYQSIVSKKNVVVKVNNKVFKKTTNKEGIVIVKPQMGAGKVTITAKYDGEWDIAGSSAEKTIKCVKGSVKNPLKSKIPLKNGKPDIDVMPWTYVHGDGDMSYTLSKAQYRDVIKRDSYCLFLNKKLSKYTFFKSKAAPKLNHIIKREKWNVIERAINTKIVKKNQKGYWPSEITASLKGKSYTYSEVRDEQNTGYTCGPTASSICSQVLRNYICEKQLTQQGDADPYEGSSTRGLKIALEKNNFKCSYYYQSSFNKALKELKKGGCALVFHTWSHFLSIVDISKDGKKVLIVNPSGDYEHGSHLIPNKWLTVKYMKGRFNDYDTSGLIVKLKYSLDKKTKKNVNNFYSSMGTKWARQNTNERIPQIGL